MKMHLNLLAGAVIASGLSLSTWAQPAVVISHPPVHDGSNASRAPLPVNRPFEYNRVTLDQGRPAGAILVATHINGQTPDQFAATTVPTVPVTQIYATTTTTEPVLTPTGRSTVADATWAQPAGVISRPAVQDGSNASRAPLPVNQPFEYNRVTTDQGRAADAIVVADHIGGQTPDQFAAATESTVPVTQVYATTTTIAEPMLTPTGRSTVAAGAALDAGQMGPQIRSNAMASQDQLLAIEGRVAVSEQSIAAMQGTTPDMNAEGRAQFQSANDDVKEKAKALRTSIQAARNATGEQLAADYEAYAAAVDRVDAAAGIPSAQR